jgi:hypothetical protein
MFGHAADSGSGEAEAGNQDLEQHRQPETDEDQLAFHARKKARRLFKYEKPNGSG